MKLSKTTSAECCKVSKVLALDMVKREDPFDKVRVIFSHLREGLETMLRADSASKYTIRHIGIIVNTDIVW